jgi:uncharacterized protein
MATVHPPLSGNMAAPAVSGSTLKRWITRHPVLSYLIVAYLVTWTIFAIPLLSRSGIGILGFDAPPIEVFILAAAVFGLAGSAFLVTAIVDGRSGVRALASRYIRVRVGIQWYLFAIFGLLATALLGTMVVYGFAPLVALIQQWPLLFAYLMQVVLVTALVNLWEETGWTGFMFTRLQPRYGALVASLLVAPAFCFPCLYASSPHGSITTPEAACYLSGCSMARWGQPQAVWCCHTSCRRAQVLH